MKNLLGKFHAELSQQRLASQAEPSQAKPSRAKPSQAEPSQAKPSLLTTAYHGLPRLTTAYHCLPRLIFYSFILCSIWVPILIHFDFNVRVDPPRPR